MKYKKYLIAAAALVMIAAASVGPAMAYFTDSHIATGTVKVNLGDSALTPNESVEDMVKTIQITNSGDYDVYIRVKAIYGNTVTVTKSAGDKWSLSDGYYYYSDIVEAGGTTEALQLEITPPSDTSQESFNVIIAEEATRATYATDGTANAADWSLAIKSEETVTETTDTTATETGDDTDAANNEEGDN